MTSSYTQKQKQTKAFRQLSEAELILVAAHKQISTIRDRVKGYDDRIYSIISEITEDLEFHTKTCRCNKEIAATNNSISSNCQRD